VSKHYKAIQDATDSLWLELARKVPEFHRQQLKNSFQLTGEEDQKSSPTADEIDHQEVQDSLFIPFRPK
jgi:hypothetical protein